MDLKLHQKEILDEVKTLIQQGKKRINTIMPAGSGATTVACVVANEILNNSIVVVHTLELCDMYKVKQSQEYPQSKTCVVTANCLGVKRENAFEPRMELPGKSFVLIGTTPNERVRLQSVLPKDSIVVSVGRVPLFGDNSTDMLNMEPIVGNVFYTDELLDVRDIISANAADVKSVFEQISAKKAKTEKLIRIQKMVPYAASPEATEAELESLKRTVDERDRKIAVQEEKIKIYESILNSMGIPLEILNESVNAILKKKEVLAERIANEDVVATEELSNFIVQSSLNLFSTHVTGFNKQYFESLIEDCLSTEIWKKMDEESRTCIITSKVAYESMKKIDKDDNMDYSGVCILAAKSLDIEITKRFFEQYVDYLRSTMPIEKWPNALFDSDNILLSDEKFTLGSVKYILGIDENGEIKSNYTYRMFSNYAKARLYSVRLSDADLRNHLTKCVQCVEKVRNDYRNPAAHRASLDRITAKECIDYLVDTYKKLKEILIYMR